MSGCPWTNVVSEPTVAGEKPKMLAKLKLLWQRAQDGLPMLVMCAGVVLVSYLALFSHYRNFNFHVNDWLYKLEATFFDFKLQQRGPEKPTGQVGILAIDEKSIGQFGRWPFSRKYYEKAFKNLKKLGVQWISFDSIYSEPEKTLLEDVERQVRTMPKASLVRKVPPKGKQGDVDKLTELVLTSPADMGFARGLGEFRHIILGYFYFASQKALQQNIGNRRNPYEGAEAMLTSELAVDMPEGRKLGDYRVITKAHGIVPNIPIVASASPHFGFFSNEADSDAINRWVTLVADVNGVLMPSLALKTAAEHLNSDVLVTLDQDPSAGIERITLVNRKDNSERHIPIDPQGAGRVLVNHRGPGNQIRHFSLADAYNNTFTNDERKSLKGMTLMLGATAIAMNDARPNPFDAAINGVEIHATAVDNIVKGATGDLLRRPVSIYALELYIVLGVGLLFAPLMIWGRAVFSAVAVLVFLIGYYYVDKYLWFNRGVWTFTLVPAFEMVSMFITTTLYKYIVEERARKQIKGTFQQYLSKDVIEQVLQDPDSQKLGGVRKDVTVFFSDVRDFTTISEKLSAEKLGELMNVYFNSTTPSVLSTGGTLDKFIGDAIMAFWGAPLPMVDQADRACQSSLEILHAVDKLRVDLPKMGLPMVDMGIGLNSGPASVGNFGSSQRFCYTVMGDTVNLAARLEGLTKQFGVKILISEYTRAQLKRTDFFMRDLAVITVKGKDQPVRIFELMRPDYLKQESALKNFIGEFEDGRQAFAAREWAKAEKSFMNCMLIKPDDLPTNQYLEEIAEFKVTEPGKNWDGVKRFKTK